MSGQTTTRHRRALPLALMLPLVWAPEQWAYFTMLRLARQAQAQGRRANK
jgi:hypothetical protein